MPRAESDRHGCVAQGHPCADPAPLSSAGLDSHLDEVGEACQEQVGFPLREGSHIDNEIAHVCKQASTFSDESATPSAQTAWTESPSTCTTEDSSRNFSEEALANDDRFVDATTEAANDE